ncbi:MAG: AsnC family transcriptional regulator [Armatimonadetes bacterium]|nr:AsnC family transcriptional regulator [Armatimonadota bacterium]
MDALDRELMNIAQSDFPIHPRPYRVLGERLGMSEAEAFERVRRLAEAGVIRRIGPAFDSRRLGHASALVAMKVPPARLDEVAEIVGSYPQVTHDYGRDHEYNLWFTLVCRNPSETERIAAEIGDRTGIRDLRVLSAERMFKIKVDFEL